jgi:hypothetical protein
MAYHFGKRAYCTIEKQTNAGTAASTVVQGINITEAPTLKGISERKTLQTFKKTSSGVTDFAVTRISAEGDITAPATPGSGLEYMLEGVLGTDTPADGTGHYDHVYTVTDTLPHYTVLIGLDALAPEQFKDVQFKSLNLSMQPGSEVMAKASVMGTPDGIAGSEVTPTYGTERPFTWTDVSISLGGSPNCDITDFDLTIDRGVKSARTACASAGLADNVIYPTATTVTGSFSMYFQDYTEYKYFLGGAAATNFDPSANVANTKRAIIVTLTGQEIDATPTPTYNTLTITIPQAVYKDAVIETPYDDRMMIKFDFEAYWDGTKGAGLEMLSVELVSLLAATVAS